MALTSAALALEVTLDGNVFVVPDGSALTVGGMIVDQSSVQAEANAVRSRRPGESVALLKASPPSETHPYMLLLRGAADKDVRTSWRFRARKSVVLNGGIGRVTMTVDKDDPVRRYVVETGIGHAPVTDVYCGDGDNFCTVAADLPDNYVLFWSRVSLDEGDLPGMKAAVVKIIGDALPNGYHGMSKP